MCEHIFILFLLSYLFILINILLHILSYNPFFIIPDLHESLRDEESRLERVRDYLCDEIDAAKVVPLLQPSDLLTEQEKQTIMKGKERKQRTDVSLGRRRGAEGRGKEGKEVEREGGGK